MEEPNKKVEEIVVHERYNKYNSWRSDIAVVRVS
jgi:hypothetical protein